MATPAIKACLVRMLLLLLKFLLSRNYCLIPAPVDVPVIFWALTISAPSLEVIQRASSGLLVVTCSVRRYCTRSQASSGLMTSANEGIGVPSRPVMKILYRSWLVAPHLKREPAAKL